MFRYLLSPRIWMIFFVMAQPGIAVGMIAGVAYFTDVKLVFPQLGATAFILFKTPMAAAGSPRNAILSHGVAILFGWLALGLFALLGAGWDLFDPDAGHWSRMFAVIFAMVGTSAFMLWANCIHPPSCATAIIASLSYLHLYEAGMLMLALCMGVGQAIVFNRFISGLPYPFWKCDPKVAMSYGALAGIPVEDGNYWGNVHKNAQK